MAEVYCPVCGWGPLVEFESLDELWLSFAICPCCGCEYGFDDTEEYYEKWVQSGCRWFWGEKPEGWALENQLQNQQRPWPPKRLPGAGPATDAEPA